MRVASQISCYVLRSCEIAREKLNILSFALASDARDSHHGYIRPWECPPPPPALLTQDSMPRERRHLAGGTREGGSVLPFSVLSRECSLDSHGLLRFRTNDVLLGTSGVGVCVSVVSNSPGMLHRFRTATSLSLAAISCWIPVR